MSNFLRVDQVLPDLVVQNTKGAVTKVKAHLGSKLTLLNFLHGTQCPECVNQLYSLQQHKKQFADLGVVIIVIARDNPESLAAFLLKARPRLEYVIFADPGGVAHRRVGVGGHIVWFIIDSKQTVRRLGPWRDRDKSLDYETILRFLKKVKISMARTKD
ncbi:MAG: redoxin domain-containing protein [Chloroflexi bacterium]|nr:redoxin domain-containing protein [Chloroflexota bacterium]